MCLTCQVSSLWVRMQISSRAEREYLCSENRNCFQGSFLLLHLLLQFINQVLLQRQRSLCLLQPAAQISSLKMFTHKFMFRPDSKLNEGKNFSFSFFFYLILQLGIIVSKETRISMLQLRQLFPEEIKGAQFYNAVHWTVTVQKAKGDLNKLPVNNTVITNQNINQTSSASLSMKIHRLVTIKWQIWPWPHFGLKPTMVSPCD